MVQISNLGRNILEEIAIIKKPQFRGFFYALKCSQLIVLHSKKI